MAIAFNLPSDEATEESYSRLNRLLAELYEVLCHILVTRQSSDTENTQSGTAEIRSRERPQSDSALPDLLSHIPGTSRRRPRSATGVSSLATAAINDLDDDVFLDPGSPGLPNRGIMLAPGLPGLVARDAGLAPGLPNLTARGMFFNGRPGLLTRRLGSIVDGEKHWQDKGGTDVDEADGGVIEREGNEVEESVEEIDMDTTDGPSSSNNKEDTASSQGSLLSLLIPDKLSGSIWTAVLFVVGWRLLANKR